MSAPICESTPPGAITRSRIVGLKVISICNPDEYCRLPFHRGYTRLYPTTPVLGQWVRWLVSLTNVVLSHFGEFCQSDR